MAHKKGKKRHDNGYSYTKTQAFNWFREMDNGRSMQAIADQYGVCRTTLYRAKKIYLEEYNKAKEEKVAVAEREKYDTEVISKESAKVVTLALAVMGNRLNNELMGINDKDVPKVSNNTLIKIYEVVAEYLLPKMASENKEDEGNKSKSIQDINNELTQIIYNNFNIKNSKKKNNGIRTIDIQPD